MNNFKNCFGPNMLHSVTSRAFEPCHAESWQKKPSGLLWQQHHTAPHWDRERTAFRCTPHLHSVTGGVTFRHVTQPAQHVISPHLAI